MQLCDATQTLRFQFSMILDTVLWVLAHCVAGFATPNPLLFNPSNPGQFINIYFFLTISLQSKLFGFENKGNDHAQQAVQYEK